MAEAAQYQLAGSNAREIAASAEAAIRDGHVRSGEPLPTVRALAQRLGVSPATVNSAYRVLRQRGLVVGEGRRGTRVAPRPALRIPARSRPLAAPSEPGRRDLTLGLPDPELLPRIGPALARVDVEATLRISYLDAPDPQLMTLAAKAFDADGIPSAPVTVAGGALDGIERVL